MRNKNLVIVVLLGIVALLGACGATAEVSTTGTLAGGVGGARYASVVPPVYGGYTPGLTVVGTGTVEAQPDIAYLTVGVDLKADNVATVTADGGARMERILAALRSAGVAEEDIHTSSYSLWVEQRYDPQTGQPTGVVEYHLMHTVRATVRDLAKVGTILSAAVEAGANTVQEVSFSVADADKMASEARQKAVADAQKRAQEMAGALGITLGKVVSVSESGGYVPTSTYYDAKGGVMGAVAVPLPAGSFSVSISVVVVYELP